jgi:hypothetical protein
MPSVIDPETLNTNGLPGIWLLMQWELTVEERIYELETQTTTSLLWFVDVPEAILRLLLQEAEIDRIFEPPEDNDPDSQGEWDPDLVTFGFQKPIRLIKVERECNYL